LDGVAPKVMYVIVENPNVRDERVGCDSVEIVLRGRRGGIAVAVNDIIVDDDVGCNGAGTATNPNDGVAAGVDAGADELAIADDGVLDTRAVMKAGGKGRVVVQVLDDDIASLQNRLALDHGSRGAGAADPNRVVRGPLGCDDQLATAVGATPNFDVGAG
jgi:hypothetical protein